MERILRLVVAPSNGAVVFAAMLCLYYGVWPLFLDPPTLLETQEAAAVLPWLAAAWVLLGAAPFRRKSAVRIVEARAAIVVLATFAVFAFFAALTIATASSIPLLEALRGASVDEIALSREEFLKARVGWGAALPYLNAMLTGSLLPYALALALTQRQRASWFGVAGFFAYSMIFMEKAFFLRIFLPLMAVVVVSGTKKLRLSWLLAAAFSLLLLNIVLSGFSGDDGPFSFLVYRAFQVPPEVVTDSLDYWVTGRGGEFFAGATSTFLSLLSGMDRVPFEREVFEYQFGAFETGTASSNAAFFIEAYVNFGYGGVIIFSALLGALIGYIGRSEDLALRCILPLVLYTVFVGGLVGLLFSNGLIACLLASRWVVGGRAAREASTGPKNHARVGVEPGYSLK